MSKSTERGLFPPHIRAVVEALQLIFKEGEYADKVIQRTLKADKRRGSNDRAFIAQNTYEVVRWYRLLYTLKGRDLRSEEDWWEMVGIRLILADVELPRWVEFKRLNPQRIKKQYAEIKTRKIRESIPDWLDEMGEKELGDKWGKTLTELNLPAKVVLRTNLLKTNPKALRYELGKEEIVTTIINEESLVVTERKNLFKSEAFKNGWFEVQDFSSQQVARFSNVKPGMRVIDACAGAGGKTLHLATLMENKGQIIAMDIHGWKLKELKKRAKRSGLHVIDTRHISSTKVTKRLKESADLVLLDVPCSGVGVLKRNPDSKWKLSPEFLKEVKELQQSLLIRYSKMLKPGGTLVYATCSVFPSENQQQVKKFLASPEGAVFALEEDKSILPQDEGYDGFYMARMIKQQPKKEAKKQAEKKTKTNVVEDKS